MGAICNHHRFPLDLNSPTRSEAGGLFPSLKSQTKKSEYENATDDERKRDQVAEVAVDVRREQEQVRQILASAAALQAETSQSEWSEDDDDLSDDSNDDGQDRDCQGPLLGQNHSSDSSRRRHYNNRRRKFNFGLASDVESTGYTTDDAGLENLSVFNDAGLTDAEGMLTHISFCLLL